ncbi:transglycosylase SLT domain-containing protein [Polaromonas sp.]|uniref:transglycosylase SLT domain-containing protein n=1 Tax=Polaromonas sp. TaxID=1869339 RepID=UPI00286B9BC6|nr:transglycosylase SLT domain-containing protein [Polaromonas sp.]
MPGDPVLTTLPVPGTDLKPLIPNGPLRPITPAQADSRQIASTEAPRELWDRIRRGYAMPDLQNELVTEREQWYASRPDYIQRMTERSSKYLFHIVEELERRQMPTELALLPFIESAFNPQAVSTAKAAGMWQFMPATGRYFDLKQNVLRDDRRDVLASTRAALDYLQKLHGMFGDWHLALAAYNWGEGSVGRAIAKNQKAGLGTRYEDLSMPAETRLYVPKLQAVKNIVANPQAFSTELPLIENHPYFQQVQITRDIDVALAARLADVKIEDFKALNPSAHRPVIIAAGTPQILLPWDNAKVFQRNFDAYNKGQFATWTTWTAPSTMNAAEASRRTGMSEADLRSVNNIPPRMLIKTGSTLLIPRSARVDNDVTVQVADTAQVSLAPEIITRRATVKARKGESVASIAQRYSLSAANVATWNHVSTSASFKKGQQVTVYLPVKNHGAASPVASSGRHGIKTVKHGSNRTGVKSAARSAGKAGGKAVAKSSASSKKRR